MSYNKNVVEDALFQIKNLEETLQENAKGILQSPMTEEIKQLVKESLREQDEVDTPPADEDDDEDSGPSGPAPASGGEPTSPDVERLPAFPSPQQLISPQQVASPQSSPASPATVTNPPAHTPTNATANATAITETPTTPSNASATPEPTPSPRQTRSMPAASKPISTRLRNSGHLASDESHPYLGDLSAHISHADATPADPLTHRATMKSPHAKAWRKA